MPISFEIHPKRLVKVPDQSQALVVIRRNVDAKINWFFGWHLRWEWERLTRLARRDRTWRVEIYERIEEEPLELPRQDASRAFVTANKQAAADLAERVVARLARGGMQAVDHGLFDSDPPPV